jgi:cell division protein FtsL
MAYSTHSIEVNNKNIHMDSLTHNNVIAQTKIGLYTLDKIILLIVVALAIAISGVSVSKFVTVSELNYTKQDLQSQIINYREANSILEMKIAELSSPERIYEIAFNDIGMTMAPAEKIKIVNKVRVAEVESNNE